MVLTAVRGALGFLSRLPVGRDERAWEAFRTTPAALPLAGYPVGLLAAAPLALPLPAPTVALAYLVAVVAVAGINHADAVADLGDAAVVHGDAERRRAVMTDTTVGVGGVLAVAVAVAGLALAGLSLAGLPSRVAVGLAVAAEVGANLGVAALVCLGDAAHEGLGSQLTAPAGRGDLLAPAVAAFPATVLAWPSAGGAVAVAAAVAAALAVGRWARARLGGVSGDVLGAAHEAARVAALHAGVVAWTRL
ncbi:adenosylcobinamide-GDP ribazoletransferase [Halobacteriales archaeon QS_1_68_17]|nr:MAG: adenosylcobinamide-GDP ribazoletransferase [Halobacteriales archaeon QS_1_68_17]